MAISAVQPSLVRLVRPAQTVFQLSTKEPDWISASIRAPAGFIVNA